MFYRGWVRSSPLKITDYYGSNHWEKFESSRRKHNDNICAETNKLILQLDKLINSKSDSDLEWISDDLVKLCPFCAKSFTFARRKHHCRLCGAILCNSCSKFLEFKAAMKLVKPAKLYTDPYDRIEDQLQSNNCDDKPKIRNCEDCKRLIDKRVRVIEDHYNQPTFLDFYEKLRKSMVEADELILSQSSISSSTSISSNEQKETTLELKTKIQELRQSVASMSTKLGKMAERETSGRQAYLLNAIRQSVAYWLKESVDSKMNRVYGLQNSEKSSGWVSEQKLPSDSEENPLLIQIKNLEEYIRQAKLADRYEEVSALEANKRDLEIEYFIQQDLPNTSPS